MVRPSNFHASLVDELGRLIVAGQIGAGGTLPREDELAARFAVSRTVIREATKTLQALGLVTTGPRVGSRIQPLSSWRLLDPQVMDWITDADMASGFESDLLELRGMIEPAAASFAAERGSDVQIAAIADALETMVKSPGKVEHEAADFGFHEAILEASGNILLLQLKPILRAVLKASFRLSMHDHERAQASIAIHRRVADAIAARQPADARARMVELLQVAQDDIHQGPPRHVPAGASPHTTKKNQETPHARNSRKMDPTGA